MKRRSYFLFPDQPHVRAVVEQLRAADIREADMHVVAEQNRDREQLRSSGIPVATREQRTDLLHQLERGLWSLNLKLFFVVVGLALIALGVGWNLAALLFSAVAVVSLVAGLLWVSVPDISLDQFSAALRHGELLLMVDMERKDLRKVEALVRHDHPEVVLGGSTFLPA